MFFFIPVTGNEFPVTRNIVCLFFTGKDPSVTDTLFVTGSILPVTGSFSCDMGISSHVTGNILSIKSSTVCVTLQIFSVTGRIFHFPSS